MVSTPACHAGGRGFEPLPGRHNAGVAHLVERRLAKAEVAGSSPVFRSMLINIWRHGQAVRQRSAKPSLTSSNLVGASSGRCPHPNIAIHFGGLRYFCCLKCDIYIVPLLKIKNGFATVIQPEIIDEIYAALSYRSFFKKQLACIG